MSCTMRAYLPEGTDHSAIQNMMLAEGGYTTFSGQGWWHNGDIGTFVSEKVVVYECIVNCSPMTAKTWLTHAGRTFLNDNRREQAFLGVAHGDTHERIYLEQK